MFHLKVNFFRKPTALMAQSPKSLTSGPQVVRVRAVVSRWPPMGSVTFALTEPRIMAGIAESLLTNQKLSRESSPIPAEGKPRLYMT